MEAKGIVILGMHRGGTSLTAELVARWGAYGNEESMVPPDANNPEGYWEFAPLVAFNNELLRAVESRWNVPPSDNQKEQLQALARGSEFRSRAFQLLEEMRSQGRPWFWKDPRLSVLLAFWKQLWAPVVYIVATRDPSHIALSLNTRDGFSTSTSFLLWQRYLSEIMNDEDIRSSAFFAPYERLMKQPDEECRCLCRFLDAQFEIQARDGDARLGAMAMAVNPRLWRSRGRPFSEHPMATLAQKKLYGATLPQHDSFVQSCAEAASLDPCWRERLALADDLLQTAAPDLCQLFWRSSNGAYEEVKSTWALIQAQGVFQTIHLPLPASQVEDQIFLRVDFSRRPGLLNLKDLVLKTPTEKVVWDWNGESECLQALTRHQIEVCSESTQPRGCLLRLDGNDPWIEIALDLPESTAVADGGMLIVGGTYGEAASDAEAFGSKSSLVSNGE